MLDPIFASTPLFLGGVALLGLLIGSFLNVVILRMPRILEWQWREQATEILAEGEPPAEVADGEVAAATPPPGLVWQRSECPHCGHGIKAHENIPLLSWLFLRGRCSACGNRISIRYPLVEAVTAITFVIVAWQFGPTLQAGALLVVTAFLIAMTGIDIDHQLLPDQLTLPLMWLGLAASLVPVFVGPAAAIFGAIVGYGVLWLIFHAFKLLTGKEGMGYGDFKLMAALGAWMGWGKLPMVILLSSLVGAIVGIALIAMSRHETGKPMPFGPFIAAAGWIALIWGDRLLDSYLRFSGLA